MVIYIIVFTASKMPVKTIRVDIRFSEKVTKLKVLVRREQCFYKSTWKTGTRVAQTKIIVPSTM